MEARRVIHSFWRLVKIEKGSWGTSRTVGLLMSVLLVVNMAVVCEMASLFAWLLVSALSGMEGILEEETPLMFPLLAVQMNHPVWYSTVIAS